MIRKKRLLSIGLLLTTLSACATTPQSITTADQHVAHDTAALTTPQNTKPAQSLTADAAYVPTVAAVERPISVGNSIASRHSYHQDNGNLRPWLQEWAQAVADTKNLPLDHVVALLSEARYNATAARLMAPSKGRVKRSWVTYRERFVDPIRIRSGLDFWRRNEQALQRVEDRYGVPASIIVAIIGVETLYGTYTGDFSVLDALTTLGFSYPDDSRPERGALFRDQLADLFVLDYQGKLNAREAQGSFAGAMGLPQFMPGSLKRYAVDEDGDGKIDLYHSVPDIVGSVANFLRLHGWQPGLPVFAPMSLPAHPEKFVTGGLEATVSIAELNNDGARIAPSEQNAAWTNTTVGVINLVDEPRNTVEHRIATENFFAITQYNRSYFYATSVADLAEILAQRHVSTTP